MICKLFFEKIKKIQKKLVKMLDFTKKHGIMISRNMVKPVSQIKKRRCSVIEKIYEIVSGNNLIVKYGVYENEETETLVGLTETRKKYIDYLGGGSPDPLVAVSVTVYAASYIAGLNEALRIQSALKNYGYSIYEEIESEYDRQINKYTIKFAISEN